MTSKKMTIATLAASVIMAAPVALTALNATPTFAVNGTLVTPVARRGAPKYDGNGNDTYTTVEYGTSLAYDTIANIGGKSYFHLLDGALVLQSDVTTSGAANNPTTDNDSTGTAGGGAANPGTAQTIGGGAPTSTYTKTPANGKITIYTTTSIVNSKGISAGKILNVGSVWKTFGTLTINGVTYYNVGGDQYVAATATTPTTKTPATTPTKATGDKFKITVTAANVRNSKGALIGKTLPKNSVWKTFGTVQMLGLTYYSLGGDQYVANTTGTVIKAGASVASPTVSSTPIDTLKITARTASIVTSTGASTGRTVKQGSSWHVFGSTTIKGNKYLNLGGNQWVAAFNGTLASTNTKPVTPKVSNVTDLFTITVPAANVRNAKGALVGKKLKKGSKWKVFGSVKMLGLTYYSLGGDQYVAASTGKTASSTFSDSGPFVKKNGSVTVKYVSGYGIQVWTDQLKPVKNANGTPKTLKHGTTWKTFGYQVLHDEAYYNLGGNQWIASQYLTIH
ncbi:SLAP domain-containing protein [Lacticaseibacillus pabuli]|uniref:SLAP domain-containing protein n=1 Tax=Lacticaseibacillus pabuli TaxID=3025672 RepID=A0ABY7WQB9_9LACO|nr:SLAP domain-containing protein [Lacticaseibacillus sp. KACC 23028]WDF82379.1 SLAP domain-containing protein [Lacticaseibacillus sp. KACC 23028]